MTVDELIVVLQKLSGEGHGGTQVFAVDTSGMGLVEDFTVRYVEQYEGVVIE